MVTGEVPNEDQWGFGVLKILQHMKNVVDFNKSKIFVIIFRTPDHQLVLIIINSSRHYLDSSFV